MKNPLALNMFERVYFFAHLCKFIISRIQQNKKGEYRQILTFNALGIYMSNLTDLQIL